MPKNVRNIKDCQRNTRNLKMTKELISDWIIKEIDTLTKENDELIQWKPSMHTNPAATSNLCRLQKSNACCAKIEAYIKLLDYIKETKDANQ